MVTESNDGRFSPFMEKDSRFKQRKARIFLGWETVDDFRTRPVDFVCFITSYDSGIRVFFTVFRLLS